MARMPTQTPDNRGWMKLKPESWFWLRTTYGPNCWEWGGYRNPNGYGVLNRAGRVKVLAHRAAWELAFGPIPEGMRVLHRCDNPPCVRPDHLFLGSQADNMRDMDTKARRWSPFRGQIQAGEANHYAKLTEDDVREIRRLLADGVRHRVIAARFGITTSNVSAIKRGTSWGHVEG